MNKRYYSMEQSGDVANVNIYGDISSWEYDGSVSARSLSAELKKLNGVSRINVFVNSYGGEVAEGLAIYNALKRHKAKVVTYCDGFAASIASVIFMAGDERIMNDSSLLMIHNAWSYCAGNAEELRKQADDLEKITQASIVAYKAHSTLTEEEIKALMDAETWILPEEALSYGFATSIETTEKAAASQNAKRSLFDIVMKHRQAVEDDEAEDDEETPPPEDKPDDETPPDDEQPEDDPDEEEPEEETPDNEDETEDEGEENPDEEKPAEFFSGFFNAIMKL